LEFEILGINKMIQEIKNNPHEGLTQKIIECANEVHKRIGDGFHEVVYKRPLAIEFFFQNISFEEESQLPFSDGKQFEASDLDFIVDGKIMIMVKSACQIGEEELVRSLSDMKTRNLEVGLLINFGSEYLEIRKLFNPSVPMPDSNTLKHQLT
jgi:GxxExxY protein